MRQCRTLFPLFSLFALLVLSWMPAAQAQSSQNIYTDSLQNGWANWSWATVNLSNTSPTYNSSADSISVTAGAYQALYLHHAAQDSTPYASLTFWINGGATGGQTLQVQATLNGTAQTAYAIPAVPANAWEQVTVPLAALGVAANANFDGIWIENTSGSTLPPFYVDDIVLVSSTSPNPAATISVDANAIRHAISPLIYGVAYGTTAELSDLNAPLNRMGGNDTSTYNWELNASNKGSDWYFESFGDTSSTPGERGDTFIANSQAGGAQAMLTIPMIGWVAKLGANRSPLPSFSVTKYGPQQQTDPSHPDAGNGVSTSGTDITGNDPNDANTPSDVSFQAGWIAHLVSQWGTAANGGLKYYIMDNEPSLWDSTHRDVHPQGASMDEVYNDILAYGGAVKAADPTALVVGPEEWGWTGYFYSGEDQQYGNAHGWSNLPDRTAHNMDYLPWLLQQLQANQNATGQRLLDVFSVHFYPQGGEFSNDTSASMDLLRNRSTRALWDPNYTDESWINTPVDLIPRLKQWVTEYYPGTKVGITEYNWGAEGDINGATTQADIDGIFGQQGLDMATRWGVPAPSTPTYLAMKMYRNYDGKDSGFGDTSVSDAVADPDNLSSFAAVRSSDGALTVMVINKVLTGSTPVTVNLANFAAGGAAQVWQLTSANAITQLASLPVTSSSLSLAVPAQSVTLLVIPTAVPLSPPSAPTGLHVVDGDTQVTLSWNAVSGATSYNLYRGTSHNGESPTPVATGITGTTYTDTGLTNGTIYYYEVTAVGPGGESARSAEEGAVPQHQGPTVATAASATPSPVIGTTAALSVLGASPAGEGTLVYQWSSTGPAVVSFSPNGTNAAKNATATFTQSGVYTLKVIIIDAQGATATSSVSVTVNQTLTHLTVTPASVTLAPAATQQFTDAATDQFGSTMTASPTWTASTGTITTSGLITAGSSTASATVTATSGSVSATATVTIATAPPPTPTGNDFGFETPSVGSGGGAYVYTPSGSPWVFSGNSGIVGSGSAFNNPAAPEGVQAAFVQMTGSLSQTLSGWQSGASYTLTLAAAQRNYNGVNTQSVQVTLGGQVIATLTPTGTSFSDYTFTFTAPASGSLPLVFTGLNPNGGDNTAFVDNLRIAPVSTTPAAFTLSGLFSTGISSTGAPLAAGTADPHYQLLSLPAGQTGSATVAADQWPVGSAWMADTAASQWLSVQQNPGTGDAPGDYTYQTTFTLSGDPTQASLSGRMAADNTVTAVLLNGQPVTGALSGTVNFGGWTTLTLPVGSGFVAGQNTLQVVVQNDGTQANPTGLRVEFSAASASSGSGTGGSGTGTALTVGDAGFETPSVGSGGGAYVYTPSGSPWAFSGNSGIVGPGSAFGNPAAPEGVQAAFVQMTGSLSQTLSGWQSGASYTLTLAAAQRNYNGVNTQSVQVTLGGQVIATLTPTGTSFSDYTFTFTAPASGSLPLVFTGLNPKGGDNTAFVDNLRVQTNG